MWMSMNPHDTLAAEFTFNMSLGLIYSAFTGVANTFVHPNFHLVRSTSTCPVCNQLLQRRCPQSSAGGMPSIKFGGDQHYRISNPLCFDFNKKFEAIVVQPHVASR
uniref:Uncharacterized protein n=1 Tax=Glossina austeni TaxID=7395 RepID=A0A1A9V5A5_GLOAU